MQIAKTYSHLNGEEFFLVHKANLYDEIISVIEELDASKFKTKVSKEKGRKGELLYSPTDLNKEFDRLFNLRGWSSVRRGFYVSPYPDPTLVKTLEEMGLEEQQQYLDDRNLPKFYSYNQTDFLKEKVAVEVQMGKYFAVTYDLFVKHLAFYTGGLIDVGVEIVPTKNMQAEMSSGPPWFEKEVHNVLRHGRTTPPVPLVIIGVEP